MTLPTVVVPVFNALEYLGPCLESIARTVPEEARVVLIDDASTDTGVRPLLEAWAGRAPGRELIEHESNLGFVASANEGIRRADGDVVLLNSDTRVCGDWLGRLQACLASDPSIATATPWSNNGEIVSLPRFCQPAPPPDEPDRVAAAIASCGTPVYPQLPTAVGFCMAMAATAIRQVGLFDEQAFGRGYGEENDFCRRAADQGLRNVLCDDAYVVHAGGASFGPLGLKPDAGSMQRLLRKHPDYQQAVEDFIRSDPLAGRRREILGCLERSAVILR
ncbi:MAG: glycosyltransferase [Lysobacterales bacterium]|jgi:GT2 family glycosyltransferase